MFGGSYFAGLAAGIFLSFVPYSTTPIVVPSGPPAQWASDIVKEPARYTTTPKVAINWDPTSQGLQSYPYDDPNIPYDSPLYYYDAMVNGNQINQLFVTKWASDDERTPQEWSKPINTPTQWSQQ